MSREVHCPHCGGLVPIDEPISSVDTLISLEVAHTIETVIPGTICHDFDDAGSSPHASHDSPIHSAVLLAHPPGPDHDSLGFTIEPTDEPQNHRNEVRKDAWLDSGSNSGEFDPLESPVPDPILDAFMTAVENAEHRNHPLASEAATIVESDFQPVAPAPAPSEEIDDDEPTGPSLFFVLLASYASALTIGLLWLWASGRIGPARAEAPTLPANSVRDPAERARKLAKIPPDHLAKLGVVLPLGSLEIEPISVTRGPVQTVPNGLSGPVSTQPGEALILRLRIKNRSADQTFAPIDREAVRQPDRGFCDSLIETNTGLLELYPLAVASELGLRGESFEALKPKGTIDTIVVSDLLPPDFQPGPLTWRLRLRIAPDQIVTIGIPVPPETISGPK